MFYLHTFKSASKMLLCSEVFRDEVQRHCICALPICMHLIFEERIGMLYGHVAYFHVLSATHSDYLCYRLK